MNIGSFLQQRRSLRSAGLFLGIYHLIIFYCRLLIADVCCLSCGLCLMVDASAFSNHIMWFYKCVLALIIINAVGKLADLELAAHVDRIDLAMKTSARKSL